MRTQRRIRIVNHANIAFLAAIAYICFQNKIIMIIKEHDIEVSHLENFKGGEKHLEARMYFDGTNRILTRAKLIPGASIGVHTHEDSCEVIFILEGRGSILEEGVKKAVQAGDCLYCPKGGTHSLINDSDADLIFCAVVPQQ